MRRFIDWVYLSQQWTLIEVVRAKANKSHSDKKSSDRQDCFNTANA